MKIMSMVPKQISDDWEAKIAWLEKIFIKAEKKKVDIIVTPQEFFGGDYMMPSMTSFLEVQLRGIFEQLSAKHNVALVVSLIEEEDGKKHERLWFIDNKNGLVGKQTKLFEPAYTVHRVGTYDLYPETDFFKRFKTFKLKGAEVAGFFCWEVFSDFLMSGLALVEPDIVVSAIKFGANAYPKNVKDEDGLKKIEEIKYTSGRDIWYERLRMISEFEIKVPIVASTNSWNLRARSMPMCGILYPYLDMDFLKVTDEMLEKDILSIDDIDIRKVRGLREHKMAYYKRVGEYPDWNMAVYTMLMKIHRMERKIFNVSNIKDLDQRFLALYGSIKDRKAAKDGQQFMFKSLGSKK